MMGAFALWLLLMAIAGALYEVFPDNLYTRALATTFTLVAFAILAADIVSWLRELD